MHVELRLWVPGGQEQTGLCPTTLQRPPSIGQTVFEPEEHGSRQPPSTQAWVKLQSASRSHGRTRFSDAEADSPVSWANEVPRIRSSPDILFIFCFYCTPLPGPSGATMATGQNGCLKQGSMVVTRDHMAGPCPCSRDINARAAVGSCAIASPSRHTAWWPRERASKGQASATPLAQMQKSLCLHKDLRYGPSSIFVGDSLNAISNSPKQLLLLPSCNQSSALTAVLRREPAPPPVNLASHPC